MVVLDLLYVKQHFLSMLEERDEIQEVGGRFFKFFLINWLNFLPFLHRQGNEFKETNACSLFLIDKIFVFNRTIAEAQCDFCS